jgi:nucleotide-binding universal stress UspA family protein
VARIVVGVDQSPGARRALAWAAQEAGLREAFLQVVHAYHARELAAPFYFPSQHALPATTVGPGRRTSPSGAGRIHGGPCRVRAGLPWPDRGVPPGAAR